jgi:TPR repeat protein
MFPHLKFSKELSLLKKLIQADNQDVLHDRLLQLHYYFGMTLFVSLRFLKGCPNARRMRHLHILIQRHIIANMSAALYQYALTLVSTGQCAAAMVHLNSSIIRGHLPSRALKAHILLDVREGVAKDYKKAFELVEEGARLGCHHCQGVMAECYRCGRGCVRDTSRSLELARESSGKGSRYGQYTLGLLYDRGEGGVAQDDAQALALYRLAAAQNLDGAQWHLGYMYDHGFSVAEDVHEALRLFQLAAAQGHPVALFWVAFCHEYGRGISKNKAEAIRWYRHALAAGYWGAAAELHRLDALE